MKTPEEIKKLLANHKGCIYDGDALMADALAYIQRLEAELKKVKHELDLALWDSPPMGGFHDD